MQIKALAFDKWPVTIVHIYEEYNVLNAVCVTPNGVFENYFLKDLIVVDAAYLPNHKEKI
jgi:hypothetical protein